MVTKEKIGAPILVLNCILIIVFSMINGIHDGWGYIEPYLASYLHKNDPYITTSMVQWLYFAILLTSI